MSDVELIFAVLAVLYAWECACWFPRRSVAFVSWLGWTWRMRAPNDVLGNQRGGFVFACPLPPLGSLLAGSAYPLSISAEGVLSYVPFAPTRGPLPPQTGRWFRFEDLRAVKAEGKHVTLNGIRIFKAGSLTAAAEITDDIRRLKDMAPGKRGQAIEEIFNRRLDHKAARERWDLLNSLTPDLGWTTNCLVAYVFLLCPVIIWRLGFMSCWWVLLVGLFALTSANAFTFRRTHKRLYPGAEEERFTHFLIILLAPATAMRTHDLLSRPLLAGYHPVAIARGFCSKEAWEESARQALREVRYPARPLCPVEAPAAAECESFSRATQLRILETFLKQHGLEPATLLAPPPGTDESCVAFCPRCLSQFTTWPGVCPDCGGTPLERFPAALTAP